jgi:hypothetical protein
MSDATKPLMMSDARPVEAQMPTPLPVTVDVGYGSVPHSYSQSGTVDQGTGNWLHMTLSQMQAMMIQQQASLQVQAVQQQQLMMKLQQIQFQQEHQQQHHVLHQTHYAPGVPQPPAVHNRLSPTAPTWIPDSFVAKSEPPITEIRPKAGSVSAPVVVQGSSSSHGAAKRGIRASDISLGDREVLKAGDVRDISGRAALNQKPASVTVALSTVDIVSAAVASAIQERKAGRLKEAKEMIEIVLSFLRKRFICWIRPLRFSTTATHSIECRQLRLT